MNMKQFLSFLILMLSIASGAVNAQQTDLTVTGKVVTHRIYFGASDEVRVNLRGLVPGDFYEVFVVQDEDNPPVAISSLPAGTTEHTKAYLAGRNQAGITSFCLDALAPGLQSIAVVVVKNRFFFPLGTNEKVVGDTIEVEENNDIDYLLNTVFRKDTCFALFPGNIRGGRRMRADGSFLGQTGIFRNGAPTVGIDSGIIVTTGWVQNAPGPNTPMASQNGPVDFFFPMNGIDPDADALAPPGIDIFDLVIMEFDFIPTTDTISFNYVFFSEQYCANLNANFATDAFGFLLTGPDGNTVNIARLPISGDIVSPATLSPGTPDAAFFRNNTTAAFQDPCMDTPPPPARLAGIGYDGFSAPLTATGAVTPCARHTLKIVIFDSDDALSDSGVLLEAGSFLAGLVSKPEPNTTADIDILQTVEGCDTATIKFTRRTLDAPFINRPLRVKYNIIPYFGAGINEATRTTDPNNPTGADYYLPESPFVIPPGDTSATLRIPILADNDSGEGLEAFIVRYDGTCDCSENADTFYIQDNVDLTVDLGMDQTLCGGEDLILTAATSGGNGDYTYEWPDLSDTSRVSYTGNGRDTTIIVNVTDGCGLQGTGSVNILAPDFSATTTGNYSLCTDPTAQVAVDVTGPGPFIITLWVDSNNVVSSTDYRISGDTTFAFTVAADITVTAVTDLSGCGGAVLRDTARVRSADVQFTDQVVQPACGDSFGSIRINTADGNSNFSFAWADAPGNSSANRTMLPPGMYQVSITPVADPACARVVNYTLSGPPALTIDSFDYVRPGCAGENVTLAPVVSGGAGAYTFSWPNSMTTDSLLSILTSPGLIVYPVIVTDSCGEQISGSVVLNFPTFSAAIDGRYSLCNSGTATIPLTISGPPDTYTVELGIDSAGVSRTQTLNLQPGTTTLTFDYPATITLAAFTNSSGCSGDTITGTATVVDPALNFDYIQISNVTCTGGTDGSITIANAGNVALTYQWSDNGPATATRTNLSAGFYAVTITDTEDAACARDTTFEVSEPASALALQQDSLRNETCTSLAYAAASYTGGTGQLTYRWSNGTTGSVLGEVAAGLYTLSVTDENQCQLTQDFNLQDLRTQVLARISASADSLSCDLTNIELSAQQNVFAVTYTWRNAAGTQLGTNRRQMIITPGRYFVTVLNPANGCTAVDSIEIGQSADLLELELPATHAINCINSSVNLTVRHPAFTGVVSYTWRFNGSIVGSNATLSGVSAGGTYEVTATRQDNGCAAVASTAVVFDLMPPAVSVPAPVVTSNCRAPQVPVAVIANGPYRFSWSTSNGSILSGQTAPTATVDGAGTYTVVVTDTLNGCTTTESIQVVPDGVTLVPNAGTDQTQVCTGNGTALNGSAEPRLTGNRFRWYGPGGDVIGESRQVFTQEAGPHILEAIHPASGCSSFDTVLVISAAPTEVSYTLQQPPCPEVGGRLFVTGVTGQFGPFTFSSPTGETEPFISGLRGLEVGTNVLIVTDQLGCELRDTFQIFPGDEFTGTAEDVEIRLGDEAVLGVSTNRTDGELVSWLWGNINDSLACLQCPDPVTSPLESFIATVAVTDTNGCVLELRQNVIVNEQELIYMPTAFSPANGDGVNDIYTVFGNAEFVTGVNMLHIYDRWGNRVFSRENFQVNDPVAGWNGLAPDGKSAPPAAYVYVVSYQRWDGVTEVRSGNFTLVR